MCFHLFCPVLTRMSLATAEDKLLQAQVLEMAWNLNRTYPDIYRLWSQFRTEQVPEDPASGIVLWYGKRPQCACG